MNYKIWGADKLILLGGNQETGWAQRPVNWASCAHVGRRCFGVGSVLGWGGGKGQAAGGNVDEQL